MRSIRIAEWILGLSMTRERAEAVAGDLRESGRGALWFWRSVLATMIASVWSEFRAVWWWLLSIAFVFGLMNVLVEVVILEGVIRHYPIPTFQRVNLVLNVAFSLVFGRWLAQFSRQRELASWVATVIINMAVQLVLSEVLWRANYHPAFISYFHVLSLLGAISARVRPRLLSSD